MRLMPSATLLNQYFRFIKIRDNRRIEHSANWTKNDQIKRNEMSCQKLKISRKIITMAMGVDVMFFMHNQIRAQLRQKCCRRRSVSRHTVSSTLLIEVEREILALFSVDSGDCWNRKIHTKSLICRYELCICFFPFSSLLFLVWIISLIIRVHSFAPHSLFFSLRSLFRRVVRRRCMCARERRFEMP